jgi:hypothetical protein
MGKKSKKFDLTDLVHQGYLKDGEKLFFVSDPSKACVVTKQPNGEYKVVVGEKAKAATMTVHAFAQLCLGMDPPDHASKWFRTASNKTLYELWHAEEDAMAA